ncbi:unnamed protein product [Rhizoctonia solani]|uniref:Uncharacterized protein n=1 Tax=Rhizoctonia solani TaxID=456999 RepID=A0A8H3HUS4_9AGAM|nr:unnamed protein product [Rhizoctonia solani]
MKDRICKSGRSIQSVSRKYPIYGDTASTDRSDAIERPESMIKVKADGFISTQENNSKFPQPGVESAAPTTVDDNRFKNNLGAVDQVVAWRRDAQRDKRTNQATSSGTEQNVQVTFAGSAPSGIEGQLIKDFNLSTIVAILTISLFVVGYCVGPLLWGPLVSENYGHGLTFLISALLSIRPFK